MLLLKLRGQAQSSPLSKRFTVQEYQCVQDNLRMKDSAGEGIERNKLRLTMAELEFIVLSHLEDYISLLSLL